MLAWSTILPAMTAAFLSSVVEVVEAFTIVLAVGIVRGWRPAILGTLAGLALLAALVLVFNPILGSVPVHLLQSIIGLLLLLFGTRWLRKAILRYAGVIPLHDEIAAFAAETRLLRDGREHPANRMDWPAFLAAFKAVLLEGVEVVFIVIAVGAKPGLMLPAGIGALAAFVLVLGIGLLVHRPLARVPENALKFAVGVMLSSFGIFWTGEGLGVSWPGEDLTLLGLIPAFAIAGIVLAMIARRNGRPVVTA